MLVNIVAVTYGALMIINLAWPRIEVYGNQTWYFRWGAFVIVGLMALVGGAYYLTAQRNKSGQVVAEHRADLVSAEAPIHPWP
jgi:hypothetical protein